MDKFLYFITGAATGAVATITGLCPVLCSARNVRKRALQSPSTPNQPDEQENAPSTCSSNPPDEAAEESGVGGIAESPEAAVAKITAKVTTTIIATMAEPDEKAQGQPIPFASRSAQDGEAQNTPITDTKEPCSILKTLTFCGPELPFPPHYPRHCIPACSWAFIAGMLAGILGVVVCDCRAEKEKD